MEVEARKKQFRGPLHGIPVGIKVIFYTKNLRTTMGTTAFADFVPTYDASVVKKLKHAGALARKAVELAPSHSEYRITLARIYATAKMLNSAVKEAERAVKLAPQSEAAKDWLKRIKRGEL